MAVTYYLIDQYTFTYKCDDKTGQPYTSFRPTPYANSPDYEVNKDTGTPDDYDPFSDAEHNFYLKVGDNEDASGIIGKTLYHNSACNYFVIDESDPITDPDHREAPHSTDFTISYINSTFSETFDNNRTDCDNCGHYFKCLPYEPTYDPFDEENELEPTDCQKSFGDLPSECSSDGATECYRTYECYTPDNFWTSQNNQPDPDPYCRVELLPPNADPDTVSHFWECADECNPVCVECPGNGVLPGTPVEIQSEGQTCCEEECTNMCTGETEYGPTKAENNYCSFSPDHYCDCPSDSVGFASGGCDPHINTFFGEKYEM